MTQSQVTAGVTGIAVPIFDAEREVLGSLSLTLGMAEVAASEVARLVERLKTGAMRIQRGLAVNS